MLTNLVFVAVFIQLLGIAGYIKDTIYGETKPNRVTWTLWAIAPLIGTVAAITDGVSWAVLPVFMAGFGPVMVVLASFLNKNAYWELTRFDYVCGLSALSALFFWYLTKDPIVAILLAVVADGLAALPTIVKAWKFPNTESAIGYSATLVAVTMGLPSIVDWRIAEYAFPIYLILVNIVILFAIYRPKIINLFCKV